MEILSCNRLRAGVQLCQHSPGPAVRHRNFGTRQPAKKAGIALQPFRANLRNRQKMNQRFFAEREIAQKIWKRTVPAGSNFAQCSFNLVRIERSFRLRFYPARLRAHRAFELTRKGTSSDGVMECWSNGVLINSTTWTGELCEPNAS